MGTICIVLWTCVYRRYLGQITRYGEEKKREVRNNTLCVLRAVWCAVHDVWCMVCGTVCANTGVPLLLPLLLPLFLPASSLHPQTKTCRDRSS